MPFMSTLTMTSYQPHQFNFPGTKSRRIESIDLLRGAVMIIMALDHVRHTFHYESYLYDPTDLTKTSVVIFFTRWITHFCAPVFVFLAGISAYLYGVNKSRQELASYLFTRGLWMVFVELFIIGLGNTYNPTYPFYVLQVIWVIGISMMILSGLIFLNRQIILAIAILLIAGHNLLDKIHVTGTGMGAFFWAILHEPANFKFGGVTIYVMYPLLPWIGIIALGYYLGYLYSAHYDTEKRFKTLVVMGFSSISVFYLLRLLNIYGDASQWSAQKNIAFSLLSLLNVTKYPPSLLYTLLTLGVALIFMAFAESPLNSFTRKIVVFGRVPFFYYVVHLYLIHLLAIGGAVISGYHWSVMILKTRISLVPELKGFGFNLLTVYMIWIGLILVLYPCCKWYSSYKRNHLSSRRWLSYM